MDDEKDIIDDAVANEGYNEVADEGDLEMNLSSQ